MLSGHKDMFICLWVYYCKIISERETVVIETVMNLDFDRICRFCLQFRDDCIDLRDVNDVKNLASDVIEKIQFCYCIKVDPSESLPAKICHQCVQVLMYFYVVKKNLEVSEQFLKNVLHDHNALKLSADSSPPGVSTQQNKVNDTKAKAKRLEVSVLLNKIKVPNTVCANQEEKSRITFTKQKLDNECKTSTPIVETKNIQKSHCNNLGTHNNNKKLDDENDTVNCTDVNLVKKKKDFLQRLIEIKDLEVKPEKIECSPNEEVETTHSKNNQVKTVKVIGTEIDLSNILSPEIKRVRKTIQMNNGSNV